MAYIGKQPTVGNFVKLDAITTSATDTFNLTNGTVAYSPQSANHCIVSLNGVIQEPTSASNVGGFTISGSTIVFTSALTSNDVIDFILVLGDVLNIGTPSDATVGFAKVTSNLITGATAETTIAGGDSVLIYDDSASALRKMTRTNFVSGLSVANTPAFYAYRSGDQTISVSTATQIQFNAEYYDTDSNFNITNYRFTPTTAGKYLLIASIGIDENTTFNRYILYLFKNGGSPFTQRRTFYYGTNEQTILNIGIFEANGTSDYFTASIFQDSGGNTTLLADGAYTYFQGFKLIGA